MFTGLESPTHLLIILVVILLFFGGKRIPELAKGLGTGMREFRKGLQQGGAGETHDDDTERDEREQGADEANEGEPHGHP
jgi:sec-independent protein translocase protein TatA